MTAWALSRTPSLRTRGDVGPDGWSLTTSCSDPSAPVTPGPAAATTLTLAASPTSILHGGTVQLSGRLQQAHTAEGIAGETLTLERRPRAGTSAELASGLGVISASGKRSAGIVSVLSCYVEEELRQRPP